MKPPSTHAATVNARTKNSSSPQQGPAGLPADYEPLELLGHGATATVWRAEQRLAGREVAVKILRAGNARNADAWRFSREIHATAALEHENIARLYDCGIEGETAWLAMELVEGMPLDDFCLDLPLRRRIEVFQGVCAGVSHAHGLGILHRDLKPANILVRADGTPKILDFGLARFVADGSLGHTLSLDGEALGTPMFIPPDRLAADASPPDARTDVYALGVLLFRLCDGGWPFDEALPAAQLLTAARETSPRAPRGVPLDLRCIIKKAMAAEPRDRYASVEALSGDLGCFLNARRVSVRAWSVGYPLRRAARRHWRTAAAAALVGAGALAWTKDWRRTEAPPPPALQPPSAPALQPSSNSMAMLREAVEQRRHAAARIEAGDFSGACQHLLTGKTLLASAYKKLSSLPGYHRHVAELHRELGDVCLHLGRSDEAMAAFRAAAVSWARAHNRGDRPRILLEAVEDSLRGWESGHPPPLADQVRHLRQLDAWISTVRASHADDADIMARCEALELRITAQRQRLETRK